MKKLAIMFMACSLIIGVSCKQNKESKKEDITDKKEVTVDKKEEIKKVKVSMDSKSNSNVSGNIVFEAKGGTVTMTAVFDGLEPGPHAIHLHEKADCSAPDAKSANGHWNPTHSKHGEWGSKEGYHKGDIGNFTADENGNGTITFSTDEWCIDCGDDLKDILGRSVIVHQGTDDFTSQPSGDAGKRVSCGAIAL